VGKDLSDDTASLHWGFKKCLIFMLKTLIPIYGIYLIVTCAIGNKDKYPSDITNYTRASLLLTGIMLILGFILSQILIASIGADIARGLSMASQYTVGGYDFSGYYLTSAFNGLS
jgi:uncharacterized membrane protein YbjE (DUF340 family)